MQSILLQGGLKKNKLSLDSHANLAENGYQEKHPGEMKAAGILLTTSHPQRADGSITIQLLATPWPICGLRCVQGAVLRNSIKKHQDKSTEKQRHR